MTTLAIPLSVGFFAFQAQVVFCQNASSAQSVAAVAVGQYQVVSRTPSSRVWQKVTLITNASFEALSSTNTYTELGDGLCVLSNGVYVDSVPQINLAADGAATAGTAISVHWAANANTPTGAVTVTSASGAAYRTRVVGLSFWDPDSGSNVLVASIQDSQGSAYGNSQVAFPNAFSGNGVLADISYDYTVSGLEQNILLRSRLPAPSELGLGTNTYFQCWTEFLDGPQPSITTRHVGSMEDDAFLWFDGMWIGVGQAFLATNANGIISGGEVLKQWVVVSNATYLVEEAPWSRLASLTARLPAHASIAKPSRRISLLASLGRPGERAAPSQYASLLASKTPYEPYPALALDYTSFGTTGLSNYTFYSDATFFLNGTVTLTGASNVMEGGCVLKCNTNASLVVSSSATLQFQTGNFLPVTFTSKDDDGFGQVIGGSTSNSISSAYANPALSVAGAVSGLTNVEFAYAKTALQYYGSGGSSLVISDARFLDCNIGVVFSGSSVTLDNDLFANVGTCFYQNTSGTGLAAQYVTFAGNGGVLGYTTTGAYASFYNSIFSQLSSFGSIPYAGQNNGFYETPSAFGSSDVTNTSYPFQAIGGGSYYLTNGCQFLTNGLGTLATASVLDDIAGKTVAPPTVYSNQTFSSATVFPPSAPRDPTGAAMGWHYPALDYVFAGCTANATLTFSNAAVGWFHRPAGSSQAGQGIHVGDGELVDFEGTLSLPCYWVRANTAQEGGTRLWDGVNGTGGLTGWATSFAAAPEVKMRWTRCAVLGFSTSGGEGHLSDDGGYLLANLANCEFTGGYIGDNTAAVAATNCLFNETAVRGLQSDANCSVSLRACTMRHGGVSTVNQASVRDCAFDATTVIQGGSGSDFSYNGILNGAVTPSPNGGHNVTNASFAWAAGPLGNFYQPSSSGLINAGDCTADLLGLYHFTVTTNLVSGLEVPETNSVVDIGYHYIATDSNGNPLDTTGDGVPDFIKDGNGDGVYGPADLADWNNPFNIYDQGRSYGGYYPVNVRLGYWRFNTNTLASESGQGVLFSNDFKVVTNWSGNAVSMTNLDSQLRYNTVSNGVTNFNMGNGSIRMWFQPNWSTGATDAPSAVRLFSGVFYGDNSHTWAVDINGSGSSLYFGTEGALGSDAIDGWFSVPISLIANHWYQFALTYSPTNIACYTNGVLVATRNNLAYYFTNSTKFPVYEDGLGLSYYWPSQDDGYGFSVGNIHYSPGGGSQPLFGQIDELETFNYALSPKAVAYGYPTFGGNATNMQDTYYVGRSDMLQTYVDGVTTLAVTNLAPCRLGYWRFDTPDLIGEQGQIPLSSSNVTLVPSWSGTALNISSATGSHVTYRDVSSNGWANINCRQGAVRFWFKPNPGAANGSILYMGDSLGNDMWSLQMTTGNTISFLTQTNSLGLTPIMTAHVGTLSTSNWTQIVLNYGPTNCALYTNGVLVTSTGGNTNWPNPTNRALGLVIGNNLLGNYPINAQIDELETFNYQLSTNDIWQNFQAIQAVDTDLDGIPDLLEDIHLPTNRPFLGAPVVITGAVEAEQFDLGGNGVGYYTTASNPTNSYRPTGMFITNCDDILGATNITTMGYCLDQTHAGEWVDYTIQALVPGQYTVEARVKGIGTNGAFALSFSNATSGVYATNGPLLITSTNWGQVFTNLTITNGVSVMRLSFLTDGATNGVSTGAVGKFNYISLYPYWIHGSPGTTNDIFVAASSLTTATNWSDGLNNAAVIQTAINNVTAIGGGTVTIDAGTYYVAQSAPNDSKAAWDNAALLVQGNNVVLEGSSNATTLIADNRATTIVIVGANSLPTWVQCANFTLRNITLVAQPHDVAYSHGTGYTNFYERGQLYDDGTGLGTGEMVGIYGTAADSNAYDILITNCTFLHGIQSVVPTGAVSNMMVRRCTFIPWDATNLADGNFFDGTTNTAPNTNAYTSVWHGGECGIYGGGDNIIIIENIYNGNSSLVPSTSNPYGYVSTNAFQPVAPDGFVWLQTGGNVFIARNSISNNNLEGIQLNAGPSAVAGNTYYTLASVGGTTALWAGTTPNFEGLTGTNANNYSTCFIGNWIYGGRLGESGSGPRPYTLNFSGNSIFVYPPFDEINDGPGGVAVVADCAALNLTGNTLLCGSFGWRDDGSNGAILLLKNDLSGAISRGIGYVSPIPSVGSALIFQNLLDEGASCHLQIAPGNAAAWFLNQNTYLSGSTPVSPFIEPAASSVHRTK